MPMIFVSIGVQSTGDTWDDALKASDDYKNGDAATKARLETGLDLLKVIPFVTIFFLWS